MGKLLLLLLRWKLRSTVALNDEITDDATPAWKRCIAGCNAGANT